jgi:toxin ParE1/3/4
MSSVRWTRRALRDLVDIADYIARDDRTAARDWIERLRERARIASMAPHGGRRVPEVARDDVRETYLRTYRIIYRVQGRSIVVLTVFEGRRRFRRINPDRAVHWPSLGEEPQDRRVGGHRGPRVGARLRHRPFSTELLVHHPRRDARRATSSPISCGHAL